VKDKNNIIKKVELALDEIRPYLEDDGGNIEVVGITKEMQLQVRLLGACSTCEVSLQTLKNGVETTIRKSVPEITSVVEVE
tara:strand:+ start:1865 stop:2107 length:243 start_codon:yes stop_codon:yes gene_type:complete